MKIVGLLVLTGWALLTAAACVVYLPAGLAVAGVACLKIAKDVG